MGIKYTIPSGQAFIHPMRLMFRCLTSFVFCCLAYSGSHAQVRLALLGGIHSSNLMEKNSIPGYQHDFGQYYASTTGFQLGVLGEIPITANFFLQPGILYSAQGNQFEKFYDSSLFQPDTLYDQHKLNLNYVEIPFYFTYKFPLSRDRKNQFYVSAGPYVSFIFNVFQSYQNRIKLYNTDQYLYQSGTEDLPVGNGQNEYKTFDFGITAKAGFELGNVLIGAYFNRGFTNVYTAGYQSGFHNQLFGGSMGVWLNKAKLPAEPARDSDHDGTPDPDDSCKTIYGTPAYHGCPVPDTDHDGINDEADSCRMEAGTAKYHGCPIPDSDRDGVNDEEDSCRLVPGVQKFHGCPVPDRDGDGLNDEADKCPDQPGSMENNGCPVVPTAMIKRAQLAAADIIFLTNSARLTKSSFGPLAELADSLRTNPDLQLFIEGYTDNTGKPEYNLRLSEERALRVKTELVKLGIGEARIKSKGYGEEHPADSNKTAAGRKNNRRVVFNFKLKNS